MRIFICAFFVFLFATSNLSAQGTWGVTFDDAECYATRLSETEKLYDSIWIEYEVTLPTGKTGYCVAKVLDNGSLTYKGELNEGVDCGLNSEVTEHWANNPNHIAFELPVPVTYAEIDINPLQVSYSIVVDLYDSKGNWMAVTSRTVAVEILSQFGGGLGRQSKN